MRNADEAISEPHVPQYAASNAALEALARFLRLSGFERGEGSTTNVQVNVTMADQLERELTVDELKALRDRLKAEVEAKHVLSTAEGQAQALQEQDARRPDCWR